MEHEAAHLEVKSVDAVAKIFGPDPWMRYDLWAARAWDAAEKAVEFSMNHSDAAFEDSLDSRVATLFHAAAVAKGFADNLNPLLVFPSVASSRAYAESQIAEILANVVLVESETEED